MKTIPLTKGQFSIVDDADYDSLSPYKWICSVTRGMYAKSRMGGGEAVAMHNVIMKPPPGMVVDHINGNGLDNRRENMRLCTPKENARNSRHGRGASKFKGVQIRKARAKKDGRIAWIAVIRVDGRLIYLGQYDTEEDAARAYDDAAIMHFGEFAWPNFARHDKTRPTTTTAGGA